jgi:alkylation response protein AidB-like acyl-CoA dehydrogenase
VNFDLSDEQRLLRDSLAGYLGRDYRFEDRYASLKQNAWRADLWKAWARDLGLFRATLPVENGGFGGGPIETMLIMEEFGKVLATEPYIEAVVLALALLRDGGPSASALAESAMDGDAIVIPALYENGARFNLTPAAATAERIGETWRVTAEKIVVAGAPMATHFLLSAQAGGRSAVEGRASLFVIDARSPQLARHDYRLIDGRAAADLRVSGAEAVMLGEPGDAAERLELAMDTATAALCAEAAGVMQVMLEQTVSYAQQRQQFGQQIDRFQVLQHRMVDMFNQLEQCRSLAIMAALSLNLPMAERQYAVSAAMSFIADATVSVAKSAVQIHGGIGTTEECAISHYFRRATVIANQFGSAAYHRSRMARAGWPRTVPMGDCRHISIDSRA